MNDEHPPAVTRKLQFDWRKDLEASRDLMRRDMDAYGYVLSWIEDWRVQRDLPPGRETMEAWWRECAKKKEQPAWRLRQWKDAIVWYLNWLELCRKSGGTGKSKTELMGLEGKLEEIYKTPALLQYGGGLRLQELVQLRIKDVDLKNMTRRQLEDWRMDFEVSPFFRNSGLDPSCSFTSPVRFR